MKLSHTLLLTLLLLGFGGGIGLWLDRKEAKPTSTNDQQTGLGFGLAPISEEIFDELSRLASTACRCSLEQGRAVGSQCWSDYSGRLRGIDYTEGATACLPISEITNCFNVDGVNRCLTTRYSVASHGINVCSARDARAIEQVWQQVRDEAENDQISRSPLEQNEIDMRARVAVDELLERLKRGERPGISSSVATCIL